MPHIDPRDPGPLLTVTLTQQQAWTIISALSTEALSALSTPREELTEDGDEIARRAITLGQQIQDDAVFVWGLNVTPDTPVTLRKQIEREQERLENKK